MRLAAVSVDLDEIDCYAQIHGLEPPSANAANAVYEKAIPRFEALFDSEGIHATFFAIGRDLDRELSRTTIKRLHDAGHEIGNHSWHHRYDLTRLGPSAIRDEIAGGARAIEAATGELPSGFRSPGYVTNDRVLEILKDMDYRYDSSVFPCPAYYAAKGAALASMKLRRRTSRSIMDRPEMLRAPTDPYRVGKPYWTRGDGVLELPIAVTRGARLPFIGTSVALAGERGASLLARQMVGRPLVNFELHGIDLVDAALDGVGFLREHQPDLRRRAASKERALRQALRTLRDFGYRFVTLAEAAEQFSRAATV